jgi:hypothetical protein
MVEGFLHDATHLASFTDSSVQSCRPFAGVLLYMSLCGLELCDSWAIGSGNVWTMVRKLVSCRSEFLMSVETVKWEGQWMARCEEMFESMRREYARLPNAWEDGRF